MKIQGKEKYWIGNLRHVIEKVRLKLENKMEFEKGRCNLENEAGIGNVEDRKSKEGKKKLGIRKSKEGIKKLGIAKVRQGMEKVRLKLENKVECGKVWGNLEIEAGLEKSKIGK